MHLRYKKHKNNVHEVITANSKHIEFNRYQYLHSLLLCLQSFHLIIKSDFHNALKQKLPQPYMMYMKLKGNNLLFYALVAAS